MGGSCSSDLTGITNWHEHRQDRSAWLAAIHIHQLSSATQSQSVMNSKWILPNVCDGQDIEMKLVVFLCARKTVCVAQALRITLQCDHLSYGVCNTPMMDTQGYIQMIHYNVVKSVNQYMYMHPSEDYPEASHHKIL